MVSGLGLPEICSASEWVLAFTIGRKNQDIGKNSSSVDGCEDVTEHYEYWKQHINPNPLDCCNLRK